MLVWDTRGAALNLSTELVGQPTTAGAWGTPSGYAGDFNLFNSTPAAPEGTWYFTLTTAGGSGDSMLLTSFQAVPEPSTWMMSGALGTVALGFVQWRRRSA
jgi:hypothetical protein